uniref:Uncharacterized protein n=1 Tax=Trypanosoma congolense (strain IL3000) TaxID=1068625 RepID=G0UVC5_TRYCI|nr:conserved hypothetical protein [Trypanosoma congolense IL3000]
MTSPTHCREKNKQYSMTLRQHIDVSSPVVECLNPVDMSTPSVSSPWSHASSGNSSHTRGNGARETIEEGHRTEKLTSYGSNTSLKKLSGAPLRDGTVEKEIGRKKWSCRRTEESPIDFTLDELCASDIYLPVFPCIPHVPNIECIATQPESIHGLADQYVKSPDLRMGAKNRKRYVKTKHNKGRSPVSKPLAEPRHAGEESQEREASTVMKTYRRFFNARKRINPTILSLFIHCGALLQNGKGFVLLLDDFGRVCDAHKNLLPPKGIVMNAVSVMRSVCTIEPSHSTPSGNDFCLTLPSFFALLKSEVRDVIHVVMRGNTLPHRPPSFCIVLAAIAPKILQEMCGTEVFQYFSNPSTIAMALKKLGCQGEVSRVLPSDFDNSVSTKVSKSPRSPNRCDMFVKTTKNRSASTPLTNRELPCSVCIDLAAGAEDQLVESFYRGVSPTSRPRRVGKNLRGSRYLETKPLDGISTSIVARVKARKLIEKLRRDAIPINRHICITRPFYPRKPKSGGVGCSYYFHDSDDSDNSICEAVLQQKRFSSQRKVYESNTSRWPSEDTHVEGPQRQHGGRSCCSTSGNNIVEHHSSLIGSKGITLLGSSGSCLSYSPSPPARTPNAKALNCRNGWAFSLDAPTAPYHRCTPRHFRRRRIEPAVPLTDAIAARFVMYTGARGRVRRGLLPGTATDASNNKVAKKKIALSKSKSLVRNSYGFPPQ